MSNGINWAVNLGHTLYTATDDEGRFLGTISFTYRSRSSEAWEASVECIDGSAWSKRYTTLDEARVYFERQAREKRDSIYNN